MKILIVMSGERGEGGSIRGVFLKSDLEKAQLCALSQRRNQWEPVDDSEYPHGKWESGCDLVWIEEHKITT